MKPRIFRFDDVNLDKLHLVEQNQDPIKIKRFVEILQQEGSDYEFPPIQVSEGYFGGLFVQNGHHRVLAYRLVGRKTIQAEMWLNDD